jgi:hypothetical protein
MIDIFPPLSIRCIPVCITGCIPDFHHTTTVTEAICVDRELGLFGNCALHRACCCLEHKSIVSLFVMMQAQRVSPKTATAAQEVEHLVRDEGVAGSNPATPTSTQSNFKFSPAPIPAPKPKNVGVPPPAQPNYLPAAITAAPTPCPLFSPAPPPARGRPHVSSPASAARRRASSNAAGRIGQPAPSCGDSLPRNSEPTPGVGRDETLSRDQMARCGGASPHASRPRSAFLPVCAD